MLYNISSQLIYFIHNSLHLLTLTPVFLLSSSLSPLCARPLSHVWLCDPVDCSLPGSSVHYSSPGKNTEVGCRAPLQGIFPIQASNLCLLHLLHCRQILYPLSHQGSPLSALVTFKILMLSLLCSSSVMLYYRNVSPKLKFYEDDKWICTVMNTAYIVIQWFVRITGKFLDSTSSPSSWRSWLWPWPQWLRDSFCFILTF